LNALLRPILNKTKDSAVFYLKKSIKTSLDAAIYDTALLGFV
jgi:hypothetical protein